MTVRVGVVGTGWGREAQIPGFNACPDTRVVAVCSRSPDRAREAARAFEVPFHTDSYEELLNQQLDLVSITTPPHLHCQMVLRAVERGLHVLCEKPTALNAAEAGRMLEAARTAGVIHLIDHELRFQPNRMKIASLVGEGALGEIHQALLVYGSPRGLEGAWDWRSDAGQGGGILGGLGTHYIDLFRWWLGEVESVSASLHAFVASRPDPETGEERPVTADEYAALSLSFESGTQAALVLSRLTRPQQGVRTELHGSRGSVALDGDERLWVRLEGEAGYRDLSQPEPLANLPRIQKNVWALSFVRLASQLVRAVKGQAEPAGATFEDGLRNQEILDAARLSAERGSARVRLEELRAAS